MLLRLHILFIFFLTAININAQSGFIEQSKKAHIKDEIRKFEYAKKDMIFLKQLYTNSDTTITVDKALQNFSFKKTVDSLNNCHPYYYYLKSSEFLNKQMVAEGVFLYHLGILRFSYYNLSNPKALESSEGALAFALKVMVGEKVNLILKTNIDNFICSLDKSLEWHLQHDYLFWTKSKDSIKYNHTTKQLSIVKEDLEKNKIIYKEQWGNDAKKFLEEYDASIKLIDKYLKKLYRKIK